VRIDDQKGIHKDFSAFIKDTELSSEVYNLMAHHYKNVQVDVVVGIGSSDPMIGTAIANRLHASFAVLSWNWNNTVKDNIYVKYDKYGGNAIFLSMEAGRVKPRQRVLIVGDVLTKSVTPETTIQLIKQQGGEVVGACFILSVRGLGERQIGSVPVFRLLPSYSLLDEKEKEEMAKDRIQEDSEEKIYKVEKIVGKRKNRSSTYYKIRWLGYTPRDDSWVNIEDCRCPDKISEYELQNPPSKKTKLVNTEAKPTQPDLKEADLFFFWKDNLDQAFGFIKVRPEASLQTTRNEIEHLEIIPTKDYRFTYQGLAPVSLKQEVTLQVGQCSLPMPKTSPTIPQYQLILVQL